MFEKILVCLDGSSLAEQILPYAVEEARRFGSTLTLLQVVTAEVPAVAPGDPQLVVEKLDEVSKEENEAMAYLQITARQVKTEGIKVEYVVEHGGAGEAIVAYAKEHGIGLIAMGTHGHSGMGRIVFGSVAEFVVRESGLPVLMVKPR
jgi:nucleotide-binding universal stress UspA family protein